MSLLAILLTSFAIGSQVVLIAHRGESADAPENTIAAFKLAWSRGVPAIELDVHLTRDGSLIVSHDADTKRTTGVSKVIKQSNLDELTTLDAGRWKDPEWAGEKMPTLVEALRTIPENGRCLIEAKVGPEAVPALVDAVQESGKRDDQLAIISFHAQTIAEAKRRLPRLKAYYLSGFKRDPSTQEWTPNADELIARAKKIKADGLDLAANGPVDQAFVRRVKDAGLELYMWTIDDPADAKRFVEMGVDGITTNRAFRLSKQLGISNPSSLSTRASE
jgi:glycerophosphoryl diester phosphodiesterase